MHKSSYKAYISLNVIQALFKVSRQNGHSMSALPQKKAIWVQQYAEYAIDGGKCLINSF